MAADVVATWRAAGAPPASARTGSGLQEVARSICRRAGADAGCVGWTMVAVVSEFWREKFAGRATSGRLLLLPDCPSVAPRESGRTGEAEVPHVCGPGCDVATLWSAARDSGWTVMPTSAGLAAIGGLLTGQYEGVLGVASLEHLQKAFAMLPCFSLPIAAVPMADPVVGGAGPDGGVARGCRAGLDLETTLSFLGVASGGGTPVSDYLPLLREAAEMFTPRGLFDTCWGLGIGAEQLSPAMPADAPGAGLVQCQPLDAAAALSLDFLAQGGKFLRPFIALAAYDAVLADLGSDVTTDQRTDAVRAGATCSAADRTAARAAAVAIEIFHKASLVHDDIEDDDGMRYGRPTMHTAYGVPSAVNAGDYLLGLGYRIIAALHETSGRTEVSSRLSADLLSILSDAHLRLSRGQGAELWWRSASQKRISVSEALAIYGLKTSPAFEAAIAMGVRLAGLAPAMAGALDRYALHVGTAFQILNDLKDWNGDAENSRRAAGDLLGGRPTVLLALALERLDRHDADRLLAMAQGTDGLSGGTPHATDDPPIRAPEAERVAVAAELFRKADVFAAAGAIVAEQRRMAVASIATCRLGRLREVLEFLLDLAVPEPEDVSDPA